MALGSFLSNLGCFSSAQKIMLDVRAELGRCCASDDIVGVFLFSRAHNGVHAPRKLTEVKLSIVLDTTGATVAALLRTAAGVTRDVRLASAPTMQTAVSR